MNQINCFLRIALQIFKFINICDVSDKKQYFINVIFVLPPPIVSECILGLDGPRNFYSACPPTQTQSAYFTRCASGVEYIPGKSFGIKFIPNQSELFLNLYPSQSELIRVNLKIFLTSLDAN